MTRRANPTLIGAFVVAAIALVLGAVILFGGGGLFTKREPVIMYFRGSIYGLQLGAPVSFRGVRLGSVTDIGIAFDKDSGAFYIPVTAELERRGVRDLAGAEAGIGAASLRELVDRGLRAQLAMQSLVTGQLYVNFDFEPNKPAEMVSQDPGAPEVPTVATAIQELRTQFERLDLNRLADDLSQIATSVRQLVASPELERTAREVRETIANLNRLSARLDAQVEPVARDLRSTLRTADRTMRTADGALRSADRAMQRLDGAAARIDQVGGQVASLTAADAPIVRSLQQASEELARTAASVRHTVGDDSVLLRSLNRSLQDVARAARSLRDLGDTLEREPEAVLRGRQMQEP